jgi:hypothetical protein
MPQIFEMFSSSFCRAIAALSMEKKRRWYLVLLSRKCVLTVEKYGFAGIFKGYIAHVCHWLDTNAPDFESVFFLILWSISCCIYGKKMAVVSCFIVEECALYIFKV